MLVLSRKVNDYIYIDSAQVKVVEIGRSRVQIGIIAPRHIRITREPKPVVDELQEVYDQLSSLIGEAVGGHENVRAGLILARSVVQRSINERQQ